MPFDRPVTLSPTILRQSTLRLSNAAIVSEISISDRRFMWPPITSRISVLSDILSVVGGRPRAAPGHIRSMFIAPLAPDAWLVPHQASAPDLPGQGKLGNQIDQHATGNAGQWVPCAFGSARSTPPECRPSRKGGFAGHRPGQNGSSSGAARWRSAARRARVCRPLASVPLPCVSPRSCRLTTPPLDSTIQFDFASRRRPGTQTTICARRQLTAAPNLGGSRGAWPRGGRLAP